MPKKAHSKNALDGHSKSVRPAPDISVDDVPDFRDGSTHGLQATVRCLYVKQCDVTDASCGQYRFKSEQLTQRQPCSVNGFSHDILQ